MIALLKTEPSSSSSWTWPVDLAANDRTAILSAEEYQALAERVQRSDAGQACFFTDFSATGRNVMRYPIAKKVFGQKESWNLLRPWIVSPLEPGHIAHFQPISSASL